MRFESVQCIQKRSLFGVSYDKDGVICPHFCKNDVGQPYIQLALHTFTKEWPILDELNVNDL